MTYDYTKIWHYDGEWRKVPAPYDVSKDHIYRNRRGWLD